MPFKSQAQQRYMYAKHPEIAARWSKEYGTPKDLPEHASRKKSKKRRRGRKTPSEDRAVKSLAERGG